MPTRRLVGAVNLAINNPQATRPPRATGTVTEEVVSVEPGGQYTIQGAVTPTRVNTQIADGDTVSVLWQGGKPFLILDVRQRRGPGSDEVLIGGKIVETLFIAPDPKDGDKIQVWFRNATRLDNLKLRDMLGTNPTMVKWGAREDSFIVRAGALYYSFKFPRPGLDRPMLTAPKPKLIRPVERSFGAVGAVVPIASVQYNALETLVTTTTFTIGDRDETGSPATVTTSSGVSSPLARDGTKDKATTIEGSATTPFSVVDVSLDWKYDLIVTILISLNSGMVPTGLLIAGTKEKTYVREEQPIGTIVSETGDASAQGTQPELGPPPNIGWGPALSPDSDTYAAVVNVTKGTVLWKSILGTVALNFDRKAMDFGGATKGTLSFNTGFPAFTTHRLITATQGGNGFSSDGDTWARTPQAGTTLLGLAVDLHEQHALHGLDTSTLGFLGLSPLTASITETYLRYPQFAIPGDGSFSDPPGGPIPAIKTFEATVTLARDYRRTLVSVRVVKFSPHRTKAGGDMFIAATQTFFAPSPTSPDIPVPIISTGGSSSLWRLRDGAPKAIVPWNGAGGNLTLLGASLKHALWRFEGNTDSIGLTDIDNGVTKILATGAADVAEFLARSWWVLRPDLLYILDGVDKKVKNRFILAWASKTVTLDPKKIVVDTVLRDVGSLKDLPTNPALVIDTTDVHALGSRGALKSRFVKDP